MEEEKIYYRRNLPHYQPSHASYFITFRLAGSLPNEVIIKLKKEYELEEQRLIAINEPDTKRTAIEEHRKRYFNRFDDFLDKYSDSHKWLSDDRVAQVVADAIHFRDTKEYELIAYCIMPNHVHMVADVERSDNSDVERTLVRSEQDDRTEVRSTVSYKNYKLTKMLRKIKGSTARECNKILNRSGAFWQHESYDHVIRNDKEFADIISYVLNNPVKAGFVDDWKKWKWSYCI
jgi:REP element-mobilizing transposase RayT